MTEKSAFEIRSPRTSVEWQDYFDVRYRVLRWPWGCEPGSEKVVDDAAAEHFAVFDGPKIAGVGRLHQSAMGQGQIRFMAVDTPYQRQGVGRMLVVRMEKAAVDHGLRDMILHARHLAVPFYEGLGYEMLAPSYVLFGQIQHFLMGKNLV